ncbi:uncharacterized protein [Argopecten irradians]|uniref:uncharacterized protein n=1 Tax=Argopecten irradians TaxID=31199 RepID=UPI003714A4B2
MHLDITCTLRRTRIITNPKADADPVASYKELNSVDTGPISRSKRRSAPEASWNPGLYPVEILGETVDGYVRVHFTGWSKKYDQVMKEDELEEIQVNKDPLKDLGILLKENLTVGTKIDSFVRLRVPLIQDDFQRLAECAVIVKSTRTKTTYTISSRHMLKGVFGNNWDFRILNKEGDNCYIKTSTLKFYLRKRRALREYEIQTTDSGQYQLKSCEKEKGTQLVISFVKCAGNHRMLPHLANDALL